MNTPNIWTATPAEARSVSLYEGEYIVVVAFVRNYADDCDCLDAAHTNSDLPTPHRLAVLLSAELQEGAENHGGPAGRWQVLAVDAPMEVTK